MSFVNLLNHGYGERSSCLAWAITLRSRAMAIEVVVFVFEFVGSLVGTLSGHCPVYQLALQFVLGFVRIPGWYLEWTLPDPPGCVCDP